MQYRRNKRGKGRVNELNCLMLEANSSLVAQIPTVARNAGSIRSKRWPILTRVTKERTS